jgi:hypothetical protein
MKITASLYLIFQNIQMTKWMQYCDMFEEWKIVGSLKTYSLVMDVGEESFFRETLILKILGAFSKSSDESIVMAHVGEIKMGNKVILNDRYPPYLRGGVTVVSDGHKFSLLKDIINGLIKGTNIKYEVNQYNQPLKPRIYNYLSTTNENKKNPVS